MPLRLPRCAECGASIRARADEVCGYCGSLLPWEVWDELSKVRVDVVECDLRSFEDALERVEQSPRFFRAARAARRRGAIVRVRTKRRVRRRRARGEASAESAPDEMAVVGGWLILVYVIATVAWFPWLLTAVIVVFFLAAGAFAVHVRKSRARSAEAAVKRRNRAKGRNRRKGPLSVCAVGVLHAGPIERHAARPEGLWRSVALLTSRTDHMLCLADPRLALLPGECGIAWLNGVDLVRFEALERVEAGAVDAARSARR